MPRLTISLWERPKITIFFFSVQNFICFRPASQKIFCAVGDSVISALLSSSAEGIWR
jgi:hypothetical protein